jgi:quercetin dioxygenase-like cupin family protein
MKKVSDKFINAVHTEWDDLGGGVFRQLMGFDEQIMMVKVRFNKGAVGTAHRHIHSQTTYCALGKFEFMVDGEVKIISVGDGVYVKPNSIHGTKCLEEGLLIDVFSPVREDFLI